MKLLADLTEDQRRIQNHLREKAGLEPIPDPDTMLYCNKCNTWKPDEEFYRRVHAKAVGRRGRQTQCKRCANAYKVEWRNANRHPCAKCETNFVLPESKFCMSCAAKVHKFPFGRKKRNRRTRSCEDCGRAITEAAVRCVNCFHQHRGNERPKCQDCGRFVSRRKHRRCARCAIEANQPQRAKACIDCGKIVKPARLGRCRVCYDRVRVLTRTASVC